MDWHAFVLGVVASIVANLLAAAFVWRRIGRFGSALRSYMRVGSRLVQGGLSNFYQSRADYVRHREVGTLGGYLALAQQRVVLVGVWMAQGMEMENIVNDLRKLLIERRAMQINIALVDPRSHMIPALVTYLDVSPEEVRARTSQALAKLVALRDDTAETAKGRFDVRTYDIIPSFSSIILDPDTEDCRIQIDIKAFGQPRSNSFAFEFSGGGKYMVELLKDSVERWFAASSPINATVLEALSLPHASNQSGQPPQ